MLTIMNSSMVECIYIKKWGYDMGPREKLIDLIQEYQFTYGVSRKQAVAEMRKALQSRIKTEQYEADNGIQLGKYQTI